MKIAIIGFGWLGTPLGKSLLKDGHDVIGTTTSVDKIDNLNNDGFSTQLLNLNEPASEKLKDFFAHTDVCILNFPPNRRSDAQGRESDITNYGQNILKAISFFGQETNFIFVSSTGVYPDHISLAVEDNFDRSQFTETNSIAFAEEAAHKTLNERLTIVRMAGLIGENRNMGKYFAGKKDIPNGDSPVNLIHQKDCIRLIETIIERNAWGQVFNGCASEHPTRKSYYTFCCEHYGLEAPIFLDEVNPKIGKQIDNQKSKDLLEFTYMYDNPYDMVD